MDVYRIDAKETSWRLASTTPTAGIIRSNFLEDDIAGCITWPSGDLIVQVVDWRTGKWAIIKTGVPVSYSGFVSSLD
jgi:hypothetical protein